METISADPLSDLDGTWTPKVEILDMAGHDVGHLGFIWNAWDTNFCWSISDSVEEENGSVAYQVKRTLLRRRPIYWTVVVWIAASLGIESTSIRMNPAWSFVKEVS